MARGAFIVVAVFGLAAAPAFAQTNTTKTTTTKTDSTKASRPADESFVKNEARGGMAEVELGKLAAEKASNANVKAFAQRMVSDHEKANDELKQIATSKNITLPTGPDAKQKKERDRLEKLSGAAFDRAYMNAMLADHKKDVAAFMRESKSGNDPDVKAFAAKTLPTLQEHLTMAQNTDKEVVGTSGSARTKGASSSTSGTSRTGTSTIPGTGAAPAPPAR
jgi:putative membrane protein